MTPRSEPTPSRADRRWNSVITGTASVSACAGVLLMGGAATAQAQSIKPAISGLVDMGLQGSYVREQPFATVNTSEVAPDAGAFSGIVINETWAQLEPRPGQFTFGPLDDSLSAVQSYNSAHPTDPLAVKLRIFGGFTAPDWAKTIDGTPLTIPDRFAPGGSDTAGQWWKPDYEAAWSTFLHAMAAQYDGDSLIHAVAVTSCGSLTGEPFVISQNSSAISQMVADGYSDTAEQNCLTGAFGDYSGWSRTPIDYTFNPFISVNHDTKKPTSTLAFTDSLMTQCADLFSTAGRSCILGNHDLEATTPTTPTIAKPIFSEIDSLWSENPASTPVDYQAYSSNAGNCDAISVAIDYHGQSVELWPPSGSSPGYGAYPEATLAAWDQAVQSATPPAC